MTDRFRKLPFNVFIFLGLFAAAALLFSSCYIPEAQVDGGLEFDVRMEFGGGTGTGVLAGLVIDSGFEEVIKDVTQLLAVLELDLPSLVEDQIDDTATEYLLELAIGGTISFGGNPFFAVEVPYDADTATADFSIYGIPSGRDYFLYMGGFPDMDEVKQYFGLKDEDVADPLETIYYSNLFYVSGEEVSNVIMVPFTVPGVTNPIPGSGEFEINDDTFDVYSGPGWYFLTEWEVPLGPVPVLSASIIAPARQPFRVETGKKTLVEVELVEE
jgi:hypothetical protein